MAQFFKTKKAILLFIYLFITCSDLSAWGFYAHKNINRLAVFMLPTEMFGFYKAHLDYIEHQAVNPDKRRYILKEEACRHYIDLDAYSDTLKIPLLWYDAIKLFPEDSLYKHGIVPWHIQKVTYELTEAFKQKTSEKILRLSADLGHYAADANVPLHTTKNYNGQLTGQHGIHGLWESRLPEIFTPTYNFWMNKARYLENPSYDIWQAVYDANRCVDSVLYIEKNLSINIPEDKKYSFENRNGTIVKVYSEEYARKYHLLLNNQVERRMRASIALVANLWYTCWVNAGQPNLQNLIPLSYSNEEEEEIKNSKHELHPTYEKCIH